MNSLIGALEFSKVIIAFFIMIYAAYFVHRVNKNDEERKPWEYLLVSAIFLFAFELIATLQIFKGGRYASPFYFNLQRLVEVAFLGALLFSFISQHNLLVKRRVLLLTQKERGDGKRGQERSKWHERKERRHDASIDQELRLIRKEKERGEEKRRERETMVTVSEEQLIAEERASPLPGEEDVARRRAEKLIAVTEQLLTQYAERIDPGRKQRVETHLAALKAALEEAPTDQSRIEERIETLLSDDSTKNT